MLRIGLIGCALGVLVTAAVVEGVRSNRWGPTDDLRAAAERLGRLPRSTGAWDGTDVPLDPKVLQQTEAVGVVSRTYRHRHTGDEVGVLVLCGPSGPICAHTPEACYAGLGYKMTESAKRRTIGLRSGPPASVWAGRFVKGTTGSGVASELEVWWAWGQNGVWVAAEAPRRDFLLQSALYKVYLTRMVSANRPDQPKSFAPAEIFLAEFLPDLNAALSVLPD